MKRVKTQSRRSVFPAPFCPFCENAPVETLKRGRGYRVGPARLTR